MGDAYGAGERMNREGTRKVTPTGALGDPRPATAEAGAAYLDDLAAMLAAYFQEGRADWRPEPVGDLPHGGLSEPDGDLAEGIRARRAGDLAAAKAFFERRMDGEPERFDARVQLARTLILEDDLDGASGRVRPLLDHDLPAARIAAHDELALIALYRGRFAEAIDHKSSARELASRNQAGDEAVARRFMQIGYIQTEAGDYDAAAESFDRALALVPEAGALNLDVVHLAALAEVRQGRLHTAGDRLRTIGDAVFDAGLANQLRRFHQLDAELLLVEGRPDDALVAIARAIRIYDHPLYRDTEARALLAAERLATAGASLLHITGLTDARLDIPTMYVRAHYRLGRVMEAQGRPDEAARWYAAFLGYWGDSDTDLPEVIEARAALERLGSG